MHAYQRSWEKDGFFLIPELLGKEELVDVLAELGGIYPSGAEYAATRKESRPRTPSRAPHESQGRRKLFTQNPEQFAGQIDFPWAGQTLNRLTVHPRITEVAATLLGSRDLRLYQAQLWAKYTGATDYEQPHHLDYSSHTLLVPKKKSRPRQVEMFLYLTDVTEGVRQHVSYRGASPGKCPRALSRVARYSSGAVQGGGLLSRPSGQPPRLCAGYLASSGEYDRARG